MSGPPRISSSARRILAPFVGLVALSVLLQIGALLAVLELGADRERDRSALAVIEDQRSLISQYKSATYLVLVALSARNWELLLEQKSEAKAIEARFEQNTRALLSGGKVMVGGAEVALSALGAEQRALLEKAAEPWDEVKRAHVRAIRAQDQSLDDNPDLEQFKSASAKLDTIVDAALEEAKRRTYADAARLDQIQRFVPWTALLLLGVLGVFVTKRMILPLGASMEGLQKSEAALRVARDELEARVAQRTAELSQANEELRQAEERQRRMNDELERRVKERTHELKEAQARAVDLARQAGMSEVASNILHNIGNVLTSLSTSVSMLGERLRGSRIEALGRLAAMLRELRSDKTSFITADERGQKLPEYVQKLSEHLLAERDGMLEVTDELNRHVEHIRVIVDLQQSYAKTAVLEEIVPVVEIVEDVLRMSAAALGRHHIRVERRFAELPPGVVDKHKVLQILLNLISNAKYALAENKPDDRIVTVRLDRPAEDRFRVQVIDNGMGIDAETLPKLFRHGFTTRKEGHGFGLHSSAIAARVLGGSLSIHSDGRGRGATFTLELPFREGAEDKRERPPQDP